MKLHTLLFASILVVTSSPTPNAMALDPIPQNFKLDSDPLRDESLSSNGQGVSFAFRMQVKNVGRVFGCNVSNVTNNRFGDCRYHQQEYLLLEGHDQDSQHDVTLAIFSGASGSAIQIPIVGQCERYALLAQANPSVYRLQISRNNVTSNLLRMDQAGYHYFWKTASDTSNIMCSLLRITP